MDMDMGMAPDMEELKAGIQDLCDDMGCSPQDIYDAASELVGGEDEMDMGDDMDMGGEDEMGYEDDMDMGGDEMDMGDEYDEPMGEEPMGGDRFESQIRILSNQLNETGDCYGPPEREQQHSKRRRAKPSRKSKPRRRKVPQQEGY